MTRSLDHDIGQLYERHIETLTQRYCAALEHCEAERALIFAGTPLMRDRDDQSFAFRADPYFVQWVPLPDAAGSIVEFRVGHRPRLIFFSDDGYWHAPSPPPPGQVFDTFDVVHARQSRTTDYVTQRGEKTVVIGQSGGEAISGSQANSEAFIRHLDYDRAVKTPYEIECMRRANKIAVAGHRAVEATLHEGVSEFELHMQYCLASQQTENDLPYHSIIGLNEHGAVLHYQHRDTAAADDVRSLLIDAGAQANGYAADITRTYSLHDGRFAELIAAMDQLQLTICEQVRDGADFVALNERTHLLLADLLVSFDLVQCSAQSAYENGATTAFLPHGLGHLIGLQVHDVGGLVTDRDGTPKAPPDRHPYLRLTRTLQEDMVVTIEPGLYFIGALLADFEARVPGVLRHETTDAFAPYGGIRIEDNVRVKSRGHENLTRAAFSD